MRAALPDPGPPEGRDLDLGALLALVAMGDQGAFEKLYDAMAGPVYGIVRKVLRDPAQSEEVAQEVLLEVWRTAGRFEPSKGSPAGWVLTIAHRRAVDRVRSEAAAAQRELRVPQQPTVTDEVAESVESRMEAERLRHCMQGLSDLQREAITLAYYGGYTYTQVASQLGAALGTIKTRIRDGMLRLRNCLAVS